MSADSITSIASEPVPTTPTELVSTDMDRFGPWGWINSDLIAKQPVYGLDNPWKMMDVQRRQPGQPQEYYCWIHNRFKEVLASQIHLSTLQDGLQLAYRLLFGHESQTLAGWFKSKDVEMKMRDIHRSHTWTIIFQDRAPNGQFARYNQERPQEILLDFQLIDRAARARHEWEQNPTRETHMIYTRHVFMIGVILGRIFYRSMTDLIHWSPFCGTVPAEKDWERAILGGHLVGCSKVYSSKPILDSLALQIRNDGFKEHWVARDEDIDDITWGQVGWDSLLPLGAMNHERFRGEPENMTFKMKGINREGATLAFNRGYIMRVAQDEPEASNVSLLDEESPFYE